MRDLIIHLVPLLLLLLGLSFVLQGRRWVEAGREVTAAPHRFLPNALVLLSIGLIIVLSHNDWVADWPLAITLFGWVLVIKSASFLLFPRLISKADGWPENIHLAATRAGGLIAAVLGGILVYRTW